MVDSSGDIIDDGRFRKIMAMAMLQGTFAGDNVTNSTVSEYFGLQSDDGLRSKQVAFSYLNPPISPNFADAINLANFYLHNIDYAQHKARTASGKIELWPRGKKKVTGRWSLSV